MHYSKTTLPILSVFSVVVTWMRENTEITDNPNYTVKVEGERHTLLVKSARVNDGGKYCVTAVNQVGRASSCATLIVKAGTLQMYNKHLT